MSKNVRWSPDDLKKKGLVMNSKGDYVSVSSLVNKGRVEKIEPYITEFRQKVNAKETMRLYRETGTMHMPNPKKPLFQFKLPHGGYIDILYEFNTTPCAAPRMVHSDRWRKRRPVMKYFSWREEFINQSEKMGYNLGETLRVVFIIPMPKYFSKKKRADLLYQPHRQRPDADNLTKSILDAFKVDDGYVWDIRAIKIWGNEGKILIF